MLEINKGVYIAQRNKTQFSQSKQIFTSVDETSTTVGYNANSARKPTNSKNNNKYFG